MKLGIALMAIGFALMAFGVLLITTGPVGPGPTIQDEAFWVDAVIFIAGCLRATYTARRSWNRR